MIKITFVIGILLLALIFEKNSMVGLFVIGIYILFRFRKRKFNSNKGLIESGKNNTYEIKRAIEKGFESICEAITRQDPDIYYENDKKPRDYFKRTALDMDIYKN